MATAEKKTYLLDVVKLLTKQWPGNRTVNIVFHGHSVPAGYFATPFVDTFNAYPHLLHRGLKERYPYAVINAIVTAIGGENSESGAARFESEVLNHRPDVVTVDYGLNDRGLGLPRARDAWERMLDLSLAAGSKVILLTPTMDIPGFYGPQAKEWDSLEMSAEQIRGLAAEYGVGLADSFAAFERHIAGGGETGDLLSWVNHPGRKGHELVAAALLQWFPLILPD
jgi:acyl-CoA thioesterase I